MVQIAAIVHDFELKVKSVVTYAISVVCAALARSFEITRNQEQRRQ